MIFESSAFIFLIFMMIIFEFYQLCIHVVLNYLLVGVHQTHVFGQTGSFFWFGQSVFPCMWVQLLLLVIGVDRVLFVGWRVLAFDNFAIWVLTNRLELVVFFVVGEYLSNSGGIVG
jgi:hypothetical protein